MSQRWQYRVVRHDDRPTSHVGVHEIYFHEDGTITAWSPEPAIIEADTREDLDDLLNLVRAAFEHPVLDSHSLPDPYRHD